MSRLSLLSCLLVSFMLLVSLAALRAPEQGIGLAALVAPVASLLAASSKPRAWPAPSFLWVPALAACHVALQVSLGEGGPPAAAQLAAGALSLALGLWLGWLTGARMRRLEAALEGIVDGSPVLLELERTGTQAMLPELRRARRHRRPLAMVSLTPKRALRREELERIVAEMRRAARERYVDTQLATLLVERIDGSSVVVREGDHFALLLPETDGHQARQAVARIEQEFSKALGISLRCGIASFPDEETTLAGLLSASELDMQRTPAWGDSPESDSELQR